jgi:glycosyltransferase involved in cell wall biosynthesis
MSSSPKRILIFQSDMSGGGAERSVLNLANGLDRSRFSPVLVLNRAIGPYISTLHDDIPIIEIRAGRMRGALLGLVREIRRQRPDILFSTMQGPSVMLWLARTLARSKAKLVLRESNNWTARGVSPRTLGQRIVGWAYRSADQVICLSEGVNEDTRRRYGAVRTRTIYNPVDVTGIKRQSTGRTGTAPPWNAKGPRATVEILAVGRLTRQKGFDLLIDAASLIRDLPWRLTILGEGPDRALLVEQTRSRGLEDRIFLPGFFPNPYPWFADADLFVLSSRWEGFGHVIVEAMVTGATVLATRCPSGPDEIVHHGEDGLLCDISTDAIAEGLRMLITDPPLRSRLSGAAAATSERFGLSASLAKFQSLFDELMS